MASAGARAEPLAACGRPLEKLTEAEVSVLGERHNLADGHAYRSWSAAELRVIRSCSELFLAVDRRQQGRLERAYFEAFFRLQRQTFDPSGFRAQLCFTASAGLEVIANYLRLRGLCVSLIEPCFDNLADIFKRHGIRVSPLPEERLGASGAELRHTLAGLESDAIVIVTPNNPTAWHISRENLAELARHCARHAKLLILDTCFRTYLPASLVYDQYAVLLASGADFIVLEDTGKTWPTLEIKAPFFCVSPRIAADIAEIYADFLLHVSPFAVALVTQFVLLSCRDERAHVHGVVRRNRQALYRALRGTFLAPREAPFGSVAWLRIEGGPKADELQAELAARGVFVLPGNQFYWSDPAKGSAFIRVALVRDAEPFAKAVHVLGSACREPGGGS